jgi:hypothetical protein
MEEEENRGAASKVHVMAAGAKLMTRTGGGRGGLNSEEEMVKGGKKRAITGLALFPKSNFTTSRRSHSQQLGPAT